MNYETIKQRVWKRIERYERSKKRIFYVMVMVLIFWFVALSQIGRDVPVEQLVTVKDCEHYLITHCETIEEWELYTAISDSLLDGLAEKLGVAEGEQSIETIPESDIVF